MHINKSFLSILGLGLLVGYTAHAQLGVNLGGAAPQTSLDVNGAITTRPVSVAVSGNAAAVPTNAGQVVLTGNATADIVLTTATPFAGQLLTLVNNTTGGQRALLNGIPVNNGQALLFIGDAASSNYKSADNGFAAGAATTYWNLKGNAGTSPATNFLGTTDAQDQAFRTSNTERIRILAGGNVGIGSTSPQSTLEVNGSFGANYLSVTTATYTLLATDFYVSYNGTGAGTLTLPSGLNVKGRLMTIKNSTAAQALTLNTTSSQTISGSTSLSIPAGQSVQVVTTGAASGLATYEIVDFSPASSAGAGAGVAASNGLTATNGNVTLGGTLLINTEVATGTTNGTNNLALTGKGYLGLGVAPGTTPISKLHVVTDASTGGVEDDYIFDDYSSTGALSNHLLLRSSRGTVATPASSVNGDQLGGITFAPRTGTGTGALTFSGSELYGFYKGDGTTGLTDLRFNTSGTERIRLDETGRLGLNTTTPKSTLEVNGSLAGNYRSITATGTTTLTATDFIVVYNGTAAGTFTLPSGLNAKGRLMTIKNTTAAQTLTLNTTNSETIDGSTSLSIPAGQSVQVVTTGAASGLATYEIVDFSPASSAGAGAGVAASNGLTATNGNVKLGGTLTATTNIASGGFDLTFSGTGQVAIGTTTTNGVLNVSGAMGSTSFTSGLNLTNTNGKTTASNTLSITPGYVGANTGITTGPTATYDLPGAGNHIFGDHVIPDGNLSNLGNADNRWATVYGTNGNFTGSLTANASAPTNSLTATVNDYLVVTQGAITYTLPAANANVGRTLIIYAFGGATTIASAGGGIFGPSTFSGTPDTTYALARYHRVTFICDGFNWISTAYL